MSHSWVERIVDEYVDSLCLQKGYEAYQCEPSSTLSRCLRSPCLAAFFSIVPHETPLPEALIGAEDQIRSWRDERNWGHLDLNLVLFVDRLLSPEVVSGIRQNTTLCRKFVVAAPDAAAARHQLSSLPFSPLDTEGSASLSVLSLRPDALLRQSGATDRFARDLVSHSPGVRALASRALDPEYPLTVTSNPEDNVPPLIGVLDKEPDSYDVALRVVSVENFRGIGRKITLPIGEAITVLYGVNGTGKTSLCDAIEWAVTGSLPRNEKLDADAREREAERSIINYFAHDQRASVELELGRDGEKRVKRSTDEDLAQQVTTSRGNHDWGAILTATGSSRRPGLDLRRARVAFRSCHVLQQSTIREFLDRDPSERFDALSRILGYEELLRITHKLRAVRDLLADEPRSIDPLRAELQAGLEENQARIAMIERTIAGRQSAPLPEGSISRSLAQVHLDIKACNVTTREPSVESTAESAGQWILEAMDTLKSAQNSLSDSVGRVQGLVALAVQVASEAKRVAELADRVSIAEVERLALQEKSAELSAVIDRSNSERSTISERLNSLRMELDAVRWAASNRVSLQQEEDRLSAAQQDSTLLDRERSERSAALDQLRGRIGVLSDQIATATTHLSELRSKRAGIEELIAAHSGWQRLVASLQQQTMEARQLENEVARYEQEIASLRQSTAELSQRLDGLNAQLEELGALNSRRGQLLAELRATLRPGDSICPLCGFAYKDHEDLVRHLDSADQMPSETYQRVSSEAQKAKDAIVASNRQMAMKEEALRIARLEEERAVQRVATETSRLGQLRDKARILDLLSDDADEAFVPDERHLRSSLSGVAVAEADQTLKELLLQQEEVNSRIQGELEAVANLDASRSSSAIRAEEAKERIDSLRITASEHGAAQLLNLPATSLTIKTVALDAAIQAATQSLAAVDASVRQSVESQSSVADAATALQRQLEQWREEIAAASEREAGLRVSLRAVGFGGGISPDEVKGFQREVENRIAVIVRIGERCALLSDLFQVETFRARLAEAQMSVERLQADLEAAEQRVREIRKRTAAVERVAKAFEQLTVADMSETLKALSAPLNSVFERLNGHPLFGALRIEPDEQTKTVSLRVETRPLDPESVAAAVRSDVPPRSYLSDAQLNIVALSVFLSIALYQTWSRLKLVLIDDPVQQMDDLNAASFIDLVRELSVRRSRQFVITTCNEQFYRLLLGKLACLNSRSTTHFRAYRLLGITREGPEIVVDAPYWENERLGMTERTAQDSQ